ESPERSRRVNCLEESHFFHFCHRYAAPAEDCYSVGARCSIDANQFVLDRVSHHRRRRAQLELLLEVVAMRLRGFDADAESLRDLLGSRALAYQLEHFALPARRIRRVRREVLKLI